MKAVWVTDARTFESVHAHALVVERNADELQSVLFEHANRPAVLEPP
jgi:hypothetical protein